MNDIATMLADAKAQGYAEGWSEAIEEYKWISVKDKMPSDCNEDWVLVLPYDGDYRCIPTVAEYRRGHWYGHTLCTEDDCIDGEGSPFEVKYWKPIYDEFQLEYLKKLKEQKNEYSNMDNSNSRSNKNVAEFHPNITD